MGRGPASFSIVPGGPPGPSIGLPDACPGRSRRGRVPLCRRDSTRPQNASGLTPIPPGNGFPAFLPSPLMSASPAPSLSGKPRDRRDGPSGSGLRPHRRGVPSGRSLPAPIRRPGRFPETPGPRKTERVFGGAGGLGVPGPGTGGRPEGAAFAPCGHRLSPQAGGPAAVRRSLPRRPKPSRNFIPAGDAGRRAAAHPRLAGTCEPNGAPSLFRSPPPSCRPLAPLARGVEGARAPSSGLPAPTALSVPGPSPGSRETPVEPGPAGRMFPDFTVREIAKTIPDLLRNPQKRPGRVEGNRDGGAIAQGPRVSSPSLRAMLAAAA
jgi:hypothetical protein